MATTAKLLLDTTGQSIASAIQTLNTNLLNMQGSLADLDTTSKLNLVSAINELNANIGVLANLETSSKGSLVAAINELTNKPIFDLLDEYTDGGAGLHNSIYRGKNLGTSVTYEQWEQIQAGTFKDLYIGDYWVVTVPAGTYNGTSYSARDIKFRIADFNYYLNTYDDNLNGNTYLQVPHVVIVPDNILYNAKMNDENITTGGYGGSKMRSTYLDAAKSIINNAFGSSHVLKHKMYLTSSTSNGRPSGTSTYDCTVEIMSEHMVYGARIIGAGTDPTGSTFSGFYTYDKGQLNLFKHRHDLIALGNGNNYWLRDVVSAASFADVYTSGFAHYDFASFSYGVRPACAIC